MLSTIAILVWQGSLAHSAALAPMNAGQEAEKDRRRSPIARLHAVRTGPAAFATQGQSSVSDPRFAPAERAAAPPVPAAPPAPANPSAPITIQPPLDPASDAPTPNSLPADLLRGGDSEPATPRRAAPRLGAVPMTTEESGEASAERARRYFRDLYRPADNRLSIGATARGVFTLLEGDDTKTSGRVGGVVSDLWLRWNYVGVGLSAFVLGGRLSVGDDPATTVGLVTGGGPSVGTGRLALIGRGFLDLNLGYDFAFMPGRRIATPGVAASDVSLAPHGPRVRLDFGLLGGSKRKERRFHGFGASLGFQYFVGDLSGNGFPTAATMSLGFCYYGV